MPTVLRIGAYRFFFYSNETGEPPHIHIQRDRALAKFWLNQISLASSTSFPPKEIRELQRLVEQNKAELLEAWNEHFSN
ncbi:DUF4160 domain-containing protein [Mariprofundus sp. EBB-1]|nr:DUF4160 domain-containing protein [Mariprofundus sp. EBB-1]RLL50887.1 DUF4160 domain-containing protein [Mariprofundus sp. EBB-1]